MIHLDNEFCLIVEDRKGLIFRLDKILLTVNPITRGELNKLKNLN